MQINYTKSGVAHFYCPTLYKLMNNRHHTEISDQEKFEIKDGKHVLDGQGHSSWTFVWNENAYHINHENNGGIPKCKKCGKEMIFVAGDDPGHKEK